MCLESMHIVHVGLPVLHVALVVRGYHPVRPLVTPRHAANGTVVCLGGKGLKEGRGKRDRYHTPKKKKNFKLTNKRMVGICQKNTIENTTQ